MRIYIKTGSTFSGGDASIPDDIRNADRRRIEAEVAAGTAQIIAYVQPEPERIAQAIAAAWAAADAHAKQIDENARFRFLAWFIDPASTTEKRLRIRMSLEWADMIWQQYAIVKAACLAGNTASYDPSRVGPPPFTFWEIAAS